MIAVIQRVSKAEVVVDNNVIGKIGPGFMILLGIGSSDSAEDIDWLSKKIVGLRVFADQDGVMNNNIEQAEGDILLISQFTLLASTKKGNRPSYINAAKPEIALPLYQTMIERLRQLTNKSVQTGEFGADMKVSLVNDGPVTINIDSKNRV